MSRQFEKMSGARVVDLTRLRSEAACRGRNTPLNHRTKLSVPAEFRDSATLLSMRNNLRHQASVGLCDIDAVSDRLSKISVNNILTQIRSLLDTEFGHLRVHRYRKVFTVGHQCQESLIGGLLRVQYHARELQMQVSTESDEVSDWHPQQIVWGVGDTILEAETQRQLRCKAFRS